MVLLSGELDYFWMIIDVFVSRYGDLAAFNRTQLFCFRFQLS